jgi:hypothetical protein
MYILWIKEKGTKKYIEGYNRQTKEECLLLYKKFFSHCDYKIEKEAQK